MLSGIVGQGTSSKSFSLMKEIVVPAAEEQPFELIGLGDPTQRRCMIGETGEALSE